MATHSGIHVWRIPWTRNLVVYDPQDSKELDTTEVTQQARTFTYHLPSSILLAFSFLLQFKKLKLLASHQYFDSHFLETIMLIICTAWLLKFMYIQSLMIKLNCFCGIIRNKKSLIPDIELLKPLNFLLVVRGESFVIHMSLYQT